ncbi:hypothetical protein RUM44_008330 [Polyplax serrata]|uniref:Rotatin N-terminal domain-containing protein n=1 Tax=Polyplax serrata TaxID=468196 RepID=A0ABR1B809_POLSC
MSEHLLSLMHIEKLGHPIEEIRIRALASIISKYHLNLVDESNVENTRAIIDKLCNWFNFGNCQEEKKVIELLHAVLKSTGGRLIIPEIGENALLKKICCLEKKIGYKYSSVFDEIKQFIKGSEETLQNSVKSNNNIENEELLLNMVNSKFESQNKYKHNSDYKIEIKASSYPLESINNDFSHLNFNENGTKEYSTQQTISINKAHFKIQTFPWQNLVPNDKKVLSCIFDGLKFIDNTHSILQSCQFYMEVALRDFPIEIFIQRPLVIRTFLQLVEAVHGECKIAVLKCLIKTVQSLKQSIKLNLQTSIFTKKKEFYTTTVYPEDSTCVSDNNLNFNGQTENYFLNFTSIDDDYDLHQASDNHLKKHQLSVPEFCFEVLFKVLPELRNRCTQEEVNLLILLFYEYVTCIFLNLKSHSTGCFKDLKDKLYRLFTIIQELLKYSQTENKIIYIIILNIVIKFLNLLSLNESIEIDCTLPKLLQQELGVCIFDSSIYLLFPQLHSNLLKCVEKFHGQREKEALLDYNEIQLVLKSLKSSVTILKREEKMKTKMDRLECVFQSLPGLNFHENLNFIKYFVKSCLLMWSKSQLSEKELKIREKILLKLLSHCNDKIKIHTYSEIGLCAEELLGEKEAVSAKYECPGDKMEFLFQADVLTEIICHGLNSELEEVGNSSTTIMSHLLKSKYIMSDACWSDFMFALTPCLSLFQCYADKNTSLGRCIIKMFDPDIAKSVGLPHLELIKGNIRLLFSMNNLTRDEAISRLFWLLNREDLDHRKLPRMSVLTNLNLSGICSSVKPADYSSIQQSFYNPGKLCDVLEMLGSESLEPNLRRSVLSQLNIMLEDVLLHPTFLEQSGLKLILNILDKSLVENEYHNYPDSVIPVIEILRQICLYNVFVSQELSSQIGVFYNVLRSLFLFSSDDRLRRNAVELLCILLYVDCTLRVPSEQSNTRILSFPEIVVKKMNLPFKAHVHWRNSKHFEPSEKKTLMAKENCSKLIRVYWAMQWTGNSDMLEMSDTERQSGKHYIRIPEDMKVTQEDVAQLRECNFTQSVKKLLRDIQNATTHEAVCRCIQKLESYLLLYNVDKTINGNNTEIVSDNIISHMLWESTLERFLLVMPGCQKDEALLFLVIKLINTLLKSFRSERLVNWTEKFVTDVNKPLYKILRNLEAENSGLKVKNKKYTLLNHNSVETLREFTMKMSFHFQGRELRLSLMELIQQVLNSKDRVDSKKWFPYIELISDHLKLGRKGSELCNVAYVDWFIAVLVALTRKCSFSYKQLSVKKLIISTMEIVVAFHCTSDATISFTGLNIIKNSLFVLNHILCDTQSNIEEWEDLWFQALSDVIGNPKRINYCWLLSLWFMRDTIARASALQLFVGFSTTVKGCELLIDRMNVPFSHVWTEGFRILFDEKESCLVKEKSGLLLSNLTSHGTKLSAGSQSMSTPALITAVTKLIQNVIFIEPSEIDSILESGLLESLIRVLGDIPETTAICEHHEQCTDIIKMYISVCSLMTKCVTTNKKAHHFMIHSHYSINCFFSMINFNLFCDTSKTIQALKGTLWCEIFKLFSALLMDHEQEDFVDHSAFIALNRCMSENGVDNFISSLHIALTSDPLALRISALQFLVNFFGHEASGDKTTSIRDIFDRMVSEKAIKLSRNYGSKEFDIPENCKLNFGLRLTDILLQIFLLCNDCPTHSLKLIVYDALGSLFTIYKSAQDFCLNQNFAASIVLNLKKICIKLSMENTSNFKKLSEKKKIQPLLQDVENLFQLLTNFTYNNEKTKTEVANRYLTVVVHKLWPWCLMKESLQVVTLKMLCTFTYNCSQACRSLVLSSNFTVMSMKKMPGSVTLMNAITNQIELEMDSISKSSQFQVLCLCLQLLSNCCAVTECRSVIPKGNIFNSLTKLQSKRKKRPYGEAVVESWMRFLIAFSSHQEGQLALTKNQDILDFIIGMANTSKSNRIDCLIVLRNLCFHQLNRYRMLSCGSFLSLLTDSLESNHHEEVRQAANAIWALACNCQKDKLVLRNAGFELKLEGAKRTSILNEDVETTQLITTVLGVLKNK